MISWRYHLVSIVAVILALALGVLAGATVIGDPFVNQLRNNTQNAQHEVDQARAQIDQLTSFMKEASPFLTSGALHGQTVVIITGQNLDTGLVERARVALTQAGATVVDRIEVQDSLAAPSASDQQSLAKILGIASATPADIAGALAERFTTSPARRGTGPTGDVLARLVAAGFLKIVGSSLEDVGGLNQSVVVIAGTTSATPVASQALLVPLVESLVRAGGPVAAAESSNSSYGFVAAVQGDGSITHGAVVTVDDIDQDLGGVALVMGLRDLIAEPGIGGGSYGVHAASLIPSFLTPSPSP